MCEDKTVFADNQVGYSSDDYDLRYFLINGTYDSFINYSDGIYKITYEQYIDFNIGKNVEKFVDEINEAAKKVTTVQIEGTGVGYVNMPAFEEKIPNIMKEETISFIMDKLKKGETYVGKPVYE